MAAGDVVIVGDVLLGESGKRMLWGTVILDGGNPTPVTLTNQLASVEFAIANLEGSAATGADPNQVTSAITGTTLNVYAWKVTNGGAAGNPTEIASTDNARLVNWLAIGPRIARAN